MDLAREQRRADRLLPIVLRSGVVTAALIVGIAGAVFLARYGHLRPDYHVFREESNDLRHVSGIFHRAATGSPRGLIQLGLLVLIATPVARVMASFLLFLEERDGLYAALTLAVLAILLFSLFSAGAA